MQTVPREFVSVSGRPGPAPNECPSLDEQTLLDSGLFLKYEN